MSDFLANKGNLKTMLWTLPVLPWIFLLLCG